MLTSTSRASRWLALPSLVALATLETGCTPLTISFTVGAKDDRIVETAVAADENASSGKVALVEIRGVLAETTARGFFGGNDPGPVDTLVAQLDRAADDSSVKAVILRVNSPGGTVTASDIMYREIRRFREKSGKPVIISMSEVAASGGYYIALAGDAILAEPTTLTGSIGVIVPTISVHEGLTRLGIRAKNITSGPNKDMVDPFAPAKDSHDQLVQQIVNEFYASFRGLVVERRPNVDHARLDELTDGRVMTGKFAQAAGLVDRLGAIREAFDTAKELADLKGASLVKYHTTDARPRTMYASHAGAQSSLSATDNAPGSSAEIAQQINLLQVNAASPNVAGGGIYYLWPGW